MDKVRFGSYVLHSLCGNGWNKANIKRKNDALRRKLGLEELEKAGEEE